MEAAEVSMVAHLLKSTRLVCGSLERSVSALRDTENSWRSHWVTQANSQDVLVQVPPTLNCLLLVLGH